MAKIKDGGSQLPRPVLPWETIGWGSGRASDMSLRDFFACSLPLDTGEIEDVSKCDDNDLLERFGTEEEKQTGFEMCFPSSVNCKRVVAGMVEVGGAMPFANIELRKKLEARARAALRYMEADAMLLEREVSRG